MKSIIPERGPTSVEFKDGLKQNLLLTHWYEGYSSQFVVLIGVWHLSPVNLGGQLHFALWGICGFTKQVPSFLQGLDIQTESKKHR